MFIIEQLLKKVQEFRNMKQIGKFIKYINKNINFRVCPYSVLFLVSYSLVNQITFS